MIETIEGSGARMNDITKHKDWQTWGLIAQNSSLGTVERHTVLELAFREVAPLIFAAGREAEREEANIDLFTDFIRRQWAWSKQTFGPNTRTAGVIDHIRKELVEVEQDPNDLAEWMDVITLALDGYWRHGGKVEDLLPSFEAKLARNSARTWPDWRTVSENKAIEHVRSGEPTPLAKAHAAELGCK